MATSDKPTSSSKKEKDTGKVHKLSLKGSAKLVAEFFRYSIHSILYQRGVYPADDFTFVKKYGLSMLVSSDEEVKGYIKRIMAALDKWMKDGRIQKLVVVITNKDTSEHVERWQFNVNITAPPKPSKSKSNEPSNPPPQDTLSQTTGADQENTATTRQPAAPPTEAEIQAAMAAVFRQIVASVSCLPQLDAGAHTFNVLVYVDANADVPLEWGDSVDGGKDIVGGEKVQFRGFSTGMHDIGTLVEYKGDF